MLQQVHTSKIVEKAKEVAAKNGLEIEMKSFDYVSPNSALSNGDLDANSYQHKPFLDQFNEHHKTDLVGVAKTILNPMGIYLEKYDNFDDVPDVQLSVFLIILQTVPVRCIF